MVVVGATVVVVVVVSSHPINPPPRMPPHLLVVAEAVVVVVADVVLFPPNRPAMASGIHLYQSHLAVMELHSAHSIYRYMREELPTSGTLPMTT